MSTKKKSSSDSIVREIRRKTHRKYSAEEKIRRVLGENFPFDTQSTNS